MNNNRKIDKAILKATRKSTEDILNSSGEDETRLISDQHLSHAEYIKLPPAASELSGMYPKVIVSAADGPKSIS